MRFVDEAVIKLEAGKGGDGCLSFRRERYVARGGPNGGDGGRGGDVYLRVRDGLNTLVDFRYRRLYRADKGQPGRGQQRYGKAGRDLYIDVPAGTLAYDHLTSELIGDLTTVGETLLVAQGGKYGLGNMHFKSSTNRAPRQTSPGEAGETRELRLELQLLADVGVMGLPNAGKSSLLRVVSGATPKIAAYPFSTIHPNLGVVRVGVGGEFVIADIPGLIEGAASGAGLGIRFLKHLRRTRMLLHLVDMSSVDETRDVPGEIVTLERELRLYSEELAERERWLVFNKCDLVAPEDRAGAVQTIVAAVGWSGPVFVISAATGEGTTELMAHVNQHLERLKAESEPESGSEHEGALNE